MRPCTIRFPQVFEEPRQDTRTFKTDEKKPENLRNSQKNNFSQELVCVSCARNAKYENMLRSQHASAHIKETLQAHLLEDVGSNRI